MNLLLKGIGGIASMVQWLFGKVSTPIAQWAALTVVVTKLLWAYFVRLLEDVAQIALDLLDFAGIDEGTVAVYWGELRGAIVTLSGYWKLADSVIPATACVGIVLGAYSIALVIRLVRHILGIFPTLNLG